MTRYYIKTPIFGDDYPYHVYTLYTNRFVGSFRTQAQAERYITLVMQIAQSLSVPVILRPRV